MYAVPLSVLDGASRLFFQFTQSSNGTSTQIIGVEWHVGQPLIREGTREMSISTQNEALSAFGLLT